MFHSFMSGSHGRPGLSTRSLRMPLRERNGWLRRRGRSELLRPNGSTHLRSAMARKPLTSSTAKPSRLPNMGVSPPRRKSVSSSHFSRQTSLTLEPQQVRGGHRAAPDQPLSISDLSEAAIHIDFHSRDIGRILRGEECDCPSHLFGLPKPLHRNLRNDFLRKFIDTYLWQPGPLKERGRDRPWSDRIDADAASGEFRGGGSRQRT